MQRINFQWVFLSLLASFVAYLLPWADDGLILRPDFVLLVLLYWLLRSPEICNIGTAWVLGLLVDLATGSLFGQHAFAYTCTAFVAVSYQRRLVLFNIWQQAAYVWLMLLLSMAIILVLKVFAGAELPGWSYWLPSITGVLLWELTVFSRHQVTGSSD
jgi:rod shape-determining protein MreD